MRQTERYASALPGDLRSSEIDQLADRSWCVDCPHIVVSARSEPVSTAYCGAGTVSQSESGQLNYKVYVDREPNEQDFDAGGTLQAGQVVPEQAFWDLLATDSMAREWRSAGFLPSFSRTAIGTTIVEGQLTNLATVGEFHSGIPASGSSMLLHVFDDIRIPCNRLTTERRSVAKGRHKSGWSGLNAWEFRCCRINFLIIRDSGKLLTIRASVSEDAFPVHFIDRVTQALQFVIGQPVHWTVGRIRTGRVLEVRIQSDRPRLPKGKFLPPLPLKTLRDPKTGKLTAKFHRRLFERFLGHTLESTHKHHPLWGKLDAVHEASAASFVDAEALTLSVAIESLLADEFVDLGGLSAEEEQSLCGFLAHLDRWDGAERMKNRIRGSVSNYHRPSAADGMRKLVDLGAITKDQYDSWQRLRHPSAHSYQSSGIRTPDFIRLVQECQVLLYHLIFHAIGYQGPHTDFSTPGWPLRSYPSRKPWP